MPKLGTKLPEEGKVAEVAKRIAYAVISPFVHLALAFIALLGLILNGIWENRHVTLRPAKNLPGANSKQEEIEIFKTKKDELGKESQIPIGTFGKAEREKTFPVTILEIPPLPLDIDWLLEQKDPCEPDKKIKETCQLFLRPEKMILHKESGDKEITLGFDDVEGLAMIATNPDRRTKYHTLESIRIQMNQIPVEEAKWVLIRKEVIPGAGNKSFEEQRQLLKGGFEIPKVMDAILLNIITYASEGKYLYGTTPLTYTRCLENIDDCQIIVGGFGSLGLLVYYDFNDFDNVLDGLAGSWNFS